MPAAVNGHPFFSASEGPGFDNLIANGPVKTRSIVIEIDADATDALYVRGRLMNKDVDGLYHPISSTVTTVAISATAEVIIDGLLAATSLVPLPFTLAHPPIPGTVHLVTTANGVITTLKNLGTDNGNGYGVGADGHFYIDYATGAGVATLTTAATDTNDLKAGYQYRAMDAPDATETAGGLDFVILGEDITAAAIAAASVRTFAYDAGEFLASGLLGYSAGYLEHLRRVGIYVR